MWLAVKSSLSPCILCPELASDGCVCNMCVHPHRYLFANISILHQDEHQQWILQGVTWAARADVLEDINWARCLTEADQWIVTDGVTTNMIHISCKISQHSKTSGFMLWTISVNIDLSWERTKCDCKGKQETKSEAKVLNWLCRRHNCYIIWWNHSKVNSLQITSNKLNIGNLGQKIPSAVFLYEFPIKEKLQ